MSSIQRTLTLSVLLLLAVGTVGLMWLEGWNSLDAFYMTLITLSTVGFGEIHELSDGGRGFTSCLIAVSVVLMACWTAEITSVFVSGQITGSFRTKKERRMIGKMKGHTIVCGGGVTGLTAIRKLSAKGLEVVAICDNEDQIKAIRRHAPDVPVVEEDPKSELALLDANLLNAENLVAALDSDFENLLITITGRGIGKNIRVISFAQDNELASRMRKVGATEVICPQVLGGEHVAGILGEVETVRAKPTEDLALRC